MAAYSSPFLALRAWLLLLLFLLLNGQAVAFPRAVPGTRCHLLPRLTYLSNMSSMRSRCSSNGSSGSGGSSRSSSSMSGGGVGGGGLDDHGSRVNRLLERAFGLASAIYKDDDNDTNDEQMRENGVLAQAALLPLEVSFKTSHVFELELRDHVAAREYLALPASEYSVLDSQLIRKVHGQDGCVTFIVSVPVGDVARDGSTAVHHQPKEEQSPDRESKASQSRIYRSKRSERTKVLAVSSVRVITMPADNYVEMVSGPIHLLADSSATVTGTGEPIVESINDAIEKDRSLASLLPSWLVWGGTDALPSSIDQKGQDDPTQARVKSSIQAGFNVVLSWPSQRNGSAGTSISDNTSISDDNPINDDKIEDKPSSLRASSRAGSEIATSVKDVLSERKTMRQQMQNFLSGRRSMTKNDKYLPVRAKVVVWVKINLPLRAKLSRAIGFAPVKLLLSQAGALAVKGVIRTVGPSLMRLLEADYEQRRRRATQADGVTENDELKVD